MTDRTAASSDSGSAVTAENRRAALPLASFNNLDPRTAKNHRRVPTQTIGDLGRVGPETIRGYRALGDAGSKKDLLGAKTRELIALAVAVTRQCDGCITIHTAAALKQGATREEIVEALGVASAVNAGAALVCSARVLNAYAATAPASAP